MQDISISSQELGEFLSKVLAKAKLRKKIYAPLVAGIVETSLRGVDSHGVRLVPMYLQDFESNKVNASPKFAFKKTGASSGVLDADHGPGMAAGTFAMEKAVALAKKTGIGAVCAKNSTHFAAASIYGLIAARSGMVGLVLSQTDPLVIPYGGRRAFLGTNPICFTAPCKDDEPFCFDMATSIVARNTVRSYGERGKMLEPGWAVDADGKPCTDPAKAVAFLPFGGHKGYGLALVVEILCACLCGMPFGPNVRNRRQDNTAAPWGYGQFFLAIDPEKFAGSASFKENLQALLEALRNEPAADGVEKVRVAGDIQNDTFRKRAKEGIPLSEADVVNLRATAKKYKVRCPV